VIDALRALPLTGTGSQLKTPRSGTTATEEVDRDFSSVLAGFAAQSIATMRQGEQAALGGITGTIPIQEVVDKVLAAEHALQSTLAVREKVVSAWLEINRMTI